MPTRHAPFGTFWPFTARCRDSTRYTWATTSLRAGSGTRIKILEAFAHACPVVSTLAGAEGISAVPGKEIELAGGAHDFAQLTAALLNNPALNFQIGAGGHALALAQYDAVAQQRRLVSRLNEFLHACKLIDRKAAG